jgi:hypothetical protein
MDENTAMPAASRRPPADDGAGVGEGVGAAVLNRRRGSAAVRTRVKRIKPMVIEEMRRYAVLETDSHSTWGVGTKDESNLMTERA